jgi:transposase
LTRLSGSCDKRNTECVYYDVTNYYFEIEQEDTDVFDAKSSEVVEGLRKRGVNKEHRPCPIVQMGLMLDGDGIPIDYMLFEGNTNDCLTLLPVLKNMGPRHKSKRMIIVADKGLTTSDNIVANVLEGNGFVFSQSVRHATTELKDWILDISGYRGDEDFSIKERLAEKHVYVADPSGKKKKVPLLVRQIVFWSKDFAEHSKAERAKVIAKSLGHIASNSVSTAKAHTAVRYVNDVAYVAATGEAASHALVLDTDKIASDEQMDGYYCLITNELDRTASDIIDIYRGLWRIEETFRVTKSTLEARPVYVSRRDRICAHFLTCYIALVILRLIQADLAWEYSAEQVAADIAAINGTLMKKNYYLFSHRTHLSDRLGALCGIDLSLKTQSAQGMRDILAMTKKR